MTDFQILLKRSNLWNAAVAKYVTEVISKCTACRSTAPPQPSRKVSISSLSKELNEIICIDHFYLGDLCLIHFMDLVSRYSAVQIVNTTSLQEVVNAFEAVWVSQFWYPKTIHGDKAFD